MKKLLYVATFISPIGFIYFHYGNTKANIFQFLGGFCAENFGCQLIELVLLLGTLCSIIVFSGLLYRDLKTKSSSPVLFTILGVLTYIVLVVGFIFLL